MTLAGQGTGESKADFSRIYDRPDARAYYTTLAPLEYRIPQLAMPVVEALHTGGPILDVCCSYGINAMLLRHRITFAEFAQRCLAPDVAALSPAAVVASDRRFFAERLVRPELQVYGLDVSQPAIGYALATGLLAAGWAENLEERAPSTQLAAGLRDVTTIVCTGGVGYIGEATFERLLASVGDPARLVVVSFVLRTFEYAAIAAVLARYGLVTEQLPGRTFPQRRFADRAEAVAAVREVEARGLDPAGKEAAGWYHADCFVSRPAGAGELPDIS